MPELPDVQRFKIYLDATALHQEVAGVAVRDRDVLEKASPRKLRSRLEGRSFEATSRHGKFLFVNLTDPPVLVLHFGMTGYLDYARHDRELPEHARVAFRFVGDYRLAYVCQRKLGLVTLADSQRAFVEAHNLGPDALDDRLTFQAFSERLSGRRAAVKSALMEQSIVAGVGNIYSDEVLYQAGIVPSRRVSELDQESLRKVYRSMRRVLRTAIRNKADVSRLPRSYLLRHRDSDMRCPSCGRELRKASISGRTAYFCSFCQK